MKYKPHTYRNDWDEKPLMRIAALAHMRKELQHIDTIAPANLEVLNCLSHDRISPEDFNALLDTDISDYNVTITDKNTELFPNIPIQLKTSWL